MAAASNSIDIDRPVEQVYRFLANGLNNPLWRPTVTDVRLASGSPGTFGAVYQQKLKGPFGISTPGDYRLVQAINNFRIKFEVITGPVRPVGVFDIEPAASGSRVKFSLSYQPRGLKRLLNRMIQKAMDAEVGNLSNLKKAIEGS
jgi:uncharacterized membrane protein